MNDVKNWYFNQTLSGQVLLAVMVLLIVLLSLFELVIEPWQQRITQSRLQVADKVETVQWMEEQVRINRSLIKSKPAKTNVQLSNGSLITKIEQSAKKAKIYSSIERISPDRVGRVKVWINNGDFSVWLRWVEAMKKQGIDLVEARVSQLERNDAVNITASFQTLK
ncbi:MAG: type II secretion system protein GspM [Arenicella sp.]